MTLPAYLFIAIPQTDKYVLVYSEERDRIWRMNAIHSPKEFVRNAQSGYETIDKIVYKYTIKLCNGETRDVRMCKLERYLSVPSIGNIHQYDMGLIYNILGVEPLVNSAWHFKMSDITELPVEPVYSRIPQHVFRRFVECAIREKEECPITTDVLSVETVGAPPCGHLFDKVALKTVLTQYGCCPTCRSPAGPHAIQLY